MRILVIYFSLTGNTKFVAEAIARTVKADLLELKTERRLDYEQPFYRYLWAFWQAVMKRKPELQPPDKNPGDYDLLFIGTPVWVFDYSAPLKTFLATANLKNKKIVLFCCGGAPRNTFENMKKSLAGNEFLDDRVFFDPLKKNIYDQARQIEQWAREVLPKSGPVSTTP